MTKSVGSVSGGSVPVSNKPHKDTTTQVVQKALGNQQSTIQKIGKVEVYKKAYALYLKGRYNKALAGLKQAGKANYPPACLRLYQIYELSEIDELTNPGQAKVWKEKAASRVQWFQKEAKNGSDNAKFDLACCYLFGLGVERNANRAVEVWEALSGGGHVDAIMNMAVGCRVSDNEGVAFNYYMKAAQKGNVIAQGRVAEYLLEGKIVEKDIKKALHWLHEAAKQDDPPALCDLAHFHLEGKHGLKKDSKKALELYEKARQEGSSEALIQLGVCYQHGLAGLKPDPKKAVACNLEAAKMGHRQALYHMGNFCKAGKGLDKPDLKGAVHWYTLAAKRNHPGAQANLGICYEFGHGVPKNPQQAVHWYRKSSNQGHPGGQNNFARCLVKGFGGVAQNTEGALKLFKLAAAQGDVQAQEAVKSMESSCVIL